MRRRVCLVTIHGIGFQHPPSDDRPGYADHFHSRLREQLGETLAPVPVYVQSSWPPGSHRVEAALRRLGSWVSPSRVDGTAASLGAEPIGHVALVYSHPPDERIGGVGGEAAMMALRGFHGYESAFGLVRGLLADARAARHAHGAPTDPGFTAGSGAGFHPLSVIENDLAAYVCRNDVRERVRGFLREALARVVARDDVDTVVLNAHSQGTVVAFDVLRSSSRATAAAVGAFVCAGSPLRKYAEIFRWGDDAGAIAHVGRWINFWDPRDPVADPLAPPSSWHPGATVNWLPGQPSLYRSIDPDSGESSAVAVEDIAVDNLAHSPSAGLHSHDYWENGPEFVTPLANLLTVLAG